MQVVRDRTQADQDGHADDGHGQVGQRVGGEDLPGPQWGDPQPAQDSSVTVVGQGLAQADDRGGSSHHVDQVAGHEYVDGAPAPPNRGLGSLPTWPLSSSKTTGRARVNKTAAGSRSSRAVSTQVKVAKVASGLGAARVVVLIGSVRSGGARRGARGGEVEVGRFQGAVVAADLVGVPSAIS